MNREKLDFWRKEISNGEVWMRPKREVWRKLLNLYRLEISVPGFVDEDVVRISRFYPLTRQIITAIAFQYPTMFFKVEDPDYQYSADVLEQIANDALEITRAKKEIQQAVFDALYCNLGWLKFGYNPPGSEDVVAPYVMADDLQNDFPYVRRISPFNIICDPLTPPHNLSYARYIIEKMLVPLEFVRKDDRFSYRTQIQPTQMEQMQGDILEPTQDPPFAHQDEQEAFKEAIDRGEMVLLYEIHDRIHRRRITLCPGVDDAIEDIEHPFLEQEPVIVPDPVTGQPLLTGEFQPTGAYLVEGGLPYHAIKFDLSDESIYGLPMMEYVRDEQQTITESATRRADLLKRFSRVVMGQNSERETNPDIEQQMKEAADGSVIWVKDIDKSFRELQWGQVPQDQLGLEADMRQYEEQVLQVSQLALAGGGGRMTATQASLIASFGQLNREWLQDAVAEAYRVTTRNVLRIMSDERYLPDKFFVAIGKEHGLEAYQAVKADMLKVRFKIKIEAQSMRPLFEQLEKEDTLALVNYLIQVPEVNRREVIELILRAFRVPNPEKFLGPAADAEAVRSAQLENQYIAQNFQDPGVLPTQDHQNHLRTHMAAQQDPAVMQFMQAHMQVNPASGQMYMQLMQQHVAAHQQAMQARMQGGAGSAGGNGKTMPSMRDQMGPQMGMGNRNPMEVAANLQSQVRGNAQRMGQAVSINPEQN